MKNLAIILIAVLSLSVFNAQAAEKAETILKANSELTLDTSTEFTSYKVASKVPEGLKNAVLAELSENAQKYQYKGDVYMRLCVDHNNHIKIVGMNATKPSLKKYVSQQLSSTYVKNPGCEPGQVYLMKVNFKVTE